MNMSPVKTKDPKNYVQPKPLPFASHQGLRIQARSDTHYNCETPGREEVFLDNYARRQRQRSEQGYNSANYRPYQVLGDQMHLDEKKLILQGLGQLDENFEDDSSGSSDDNEDEGKDSKDKKDNKNKLMGPADDAEKSPTRKFVVRRSNKERKSLIKEVTTGRKMVSWTKLGHGVFNMIREQDEERINAEENTRKQKEDRRRTEWQPPTVESSGDDETDDELAEDEDLSQFMTDQPEIRKEVSFLGDNRNTESEMPNAEDVQSGTTDSRYLQTSQSVTFQTGQTPVSRATSSKPRARSGTKKKKRRNLEDARPYTPCRTNISLELYDDRPNRTALFRQLCALNWILEAMITEPPATMEPIIKCWNIKYKELKSNTFCKTTLRKQKYDKALDTRWNSFVTNPGAGHLKGKSNPKSVFGQNLTASSAALMTTNRLRKLSAHSISGRRSLSAMSGVSVDKDAAAAGGGGVVTGGQGSRRGSATRRGSAISRQDVSPGRLKDAAGGGGGMVIGRNDVSPKRVDSNGKEHSKGLTKFLDEIYESASNPGAKPLEEDETPPERTPSAASEVTEPQGAESRQLSGNKPNSARRPTLSAKQLEEKAIQITKPPEQQQISRWVANTNRKLHSRASSTKEPAKPAKPARSAFPSQKLKHMTANLRDKFADVTEDHALTLHDKLEALEKRRLWRSEEKFHAIAANLHISGQLERLRRAGLEPEDEEDKARLKMEDESKWFQDLMRHLPKNIMKDRQCGAVVEKLQSMGKIESRKVTPQKFLDVLATLKSWELCAPDISAAIEFVRDKVVGMTVEDFEAWYLSEVPGIVRSQSVPIF